MPQTQPGHPEYALDMQLKEGEQVTFGATLGREGNVLVRHMRRQKYLSKP